MKVAITGGTGFVGSHAIEALVKLRDVDIVAVGRSARPPASLPPFVEWSCIDIAAAPEDAFKRMGSPDALLHLAWGGLPNYLSMHHFDVELIDQYRFLKRLVESGLSRLVVAGTCYEYGMRDGPLDEDMAAAPANPYAYAKAALLQQLRFLQASRPFELSWTRLFYMYGERQSPRSLWPLFQAAVARGDRSFAMSGGEQLRDYLPVEQVAARLAQIVEHDRGLGVVNICSGTPISVRTMVERWREQIGATIALELGVYPYPTYEPMAFWGSTAKFDALGTRSAP